MIIILVILILLGVGGYFAYPYVLDFIHDKQFEKHMEAHDYEAAYGMISLDDDYQKILDESLKAEADAVYTSYIKGETSYADCMAGLENLGKYSYSTSDISESVQKIELGRNDMIAADKLFAETEYLSAASLYESVTTEDVCYYEYCQKRITECYDEELELRISEIKELMEQKSVESYIKAIDLTKEALEIFPDNIEIPVMEYDSENGILSVFDEYISVGRYQDVLDLVDTVKPYITFSGELSTKVEKCMTAIIKSEDEVINSLLDEGRYYDTYVEIESFIKAYEQYFSLVAVKSRYYGDLSAAWTPYIISYVSDLVSAGDLEGAFEASELGKEYLSFDETSVKIINEKEKTFVDYVAQKEFDNVNNMIASMNYSSAKNTLGSIKATYKDFSHIVERADELLKAIEGGKDAINVCNLSIDKLSCVIFNVGDCKDLYGNEYSNTLKLIPESENMAGSISLVMPEGYNRASGTVFFDANADNVNGKWALVIGTEDRILYSTDIFTNKHKPASFNVFIPSDAKNLTIKVIGSNNAKEELPVISGVAIADFVIYGEPQNEGENDEVSFEDCAYLSQKLFNADWSDISAVSVNRAITDSAGKLYTDAVTFDGKENAKSEINITGSYKKFTGDIIVDKYSKAGAKTKVSLWADGTCIYESDILSIKKGKATIDIELSEYEKLIVVFEKTDDSTSDELLVGLVNAKLYR